MSKLILVTGANGFVGSHLIETLLARGYGVRGMIRRSSDLTFVRDMPVEWAYADVSDADVSDADAGDAEGLDGRESLRQACRGVDAICHCAGLTRALDEGAFLDVNTRGTVALAQACAEVNPGLERFVFVSSQAAAGPAPAAGEYLDESCPPRPVTWYGQSKWAAEKALHALDLRLPLTILRPSAVFGPREKDLFTYFSMVHRGWNLHLGRGERFVSLIYVHDLVDSILLALENDRAVGQTYFICGPAVSHAELSAAIARALGKRPLRVVVPEALLGPTALCARGWGRLTGKPPLLNDQRIRDLRQRYWLCSGEKARRELGFVATSDFDTAVQETADWYLEHGWLS